MRTLGVCVWVAIGLGVATSRGCKCQVSTANISSVQMARDAGGAEPTTVFAPTDTFHCLVELANAPDGTTVKSVWTAVKVEGAEPNTVIDEAEVTSGSAPIKFNLTGTNPWPPGDYKVDLYLNDKLDQTLTFTVEGSGG